MTLMLEDSERFDAALAGCTFYIAMQRDLMQAEHGGTIPDNAKDEFSVGYVSGFVDGWMQAFSIEDESLCMTALGRVLQEVFGSDWELHMSRAMKLMQSGDGVFLRGMTAGGTDAFERIKAGTSGNSSAFPPMTWALHASKSASPD